MKRWYALSAIGNDRPGIVADLAQLIYECDCNLEDSSMTVLGREFAVLLLLSGTGESVGERVERACQRLGREAGLAINVRALEGEPRPASERTGPVHLYEVQATGVDKAGIVARICRCLADRGVNIADLRSQTRPLPQTGTTIYTMQILIEVPETMDAGALDRDLDRIANDLRIEISLNRVADKRA